MHAKNEAPVKKKPAAPPPSPTSKNKAPALSPAAKALCVGATAMACASTPTAPQVRLPPPEPCPPGYVEGMESINFLRLGEKRPASFFVKGGMDAQPTTVTEGPVSLISLGRRDLKYPLIYSGQLYLGENRAYGRITRARRKDGTLDVPVCLELIYSEDLTKGLPFIGERGPHTATVFSTVYVQVVKEFK